MRPKKSTIALVAFSIFSISTANSAPLTITNHSFEDDVVVVDGDFDASSTLGPTGGPTGWGVYSSIAGATASRQFGTLNPSAAQFDSVPDGSNVGLVFLRTAGIGEAGLQQTLSDTLLLNTSYTLTVEVGNFRDGDAGDSFDFNGFPGYRIDLLAAGNPTPLASDSNTLTIAEGAFETSIVTLTTGSSHMDEGEALVIRLVNLNGAGIEVNFDDVRLDASPVPEPSTTALLLGAVGLICAGLMRNRTS